MADKEEEVIVDVEEVYSKSEKYIEDNKNTLSMIVGAIVVIVGGYFGYTNLYVMPLESQAHEQMWKAEQYFEVDSFRLALEGDGNYYGFLTIINEYGVTKAANLANYYAGICYLNQGEYETAISFLGDFSSDDEILGAVALGAIGDAYMEMGNQNEALSYYKKAASNKTNDFTGPVYLMKAAFVQEQLGDYSSAVDSYNKILQEYPSSSESRRVDKYIARANSKLGKS